MGRFCEREEGEGRGGEGRGGNRGKPQECIGDKNHLIQEKKHLFQKELNPREILQCRRLKRGKEKRKGTK